MSQDAGDPEEEEDAEQEGVSSQLPRGKALREEAGTKPPVCSVSRRRFVLCEKS